MQYLAISFDNSRLKIKSHQDQSDPFYRIGLDFRCMKEQEFQPSAFHSHELDYNCTVWNGLNRELADKLSLVFISRRPACNVVRRYANRIGGIFNHFICKNGTVGKIELLSHTLPLKIMAT